MPVPDHISILFNFLSLFISLALAIYLLSKGSLRLLGLISALGFVLNLVLFTQASSISTSNTLLLYQSTLLLISLSSVLWLHFAIHMSNYQETWKSRIIGSAYSLSSLAITLFLVDPSQANSPSLGGLAILALAIFMSFAAIKILFSSALRVPKHGRFQLYSFIFVNIFNVFSLLVVYAAYFHGFGPINHPAYLSILLLSEASLMAFALFRNTAIKYLPNISYSLFELNNNLIIILDKNANIINFNGIGREFLGDIAANPIGNNIYSLIPELPSREEHLKEEPVYIFSTNLVSLNIYADISFFPLKTLGLTIDAYLLEIKDVSSHVLDFKQIERLSAFQQALLDLSNSSPNTSGFSEHFYQQVLEHAVNIIPDADKGSVLQRQRDGSFAFVAAIGYDLPKLSDFRFLKEQVFFGKFSAKQSLLVKRHNDGYDRDNLTAEQNTVLDEAVPDLTSTEATLAIPIYINDELYAIFSLDSLHSYNAFNIEMQNIAEVFAQKITSFLHKSYLQNRMLKEAGLKILFSKCENRLKNLNIDIKVLPRIAKTLLSSMDLSIDKVSLIDGESSEKSKYISYGLANSSKLEKTISAMEDDEILDYISEANSNQKVILVNDLNTENSLGKSLIFYPIISEHKTLAIAILSASKKYAFDSQEQEFVSNIISCLEKALSKQRNEKQIKLLDAFRKSLVEISDEVVQNLPKNDFYLNILEKAVSIIPDIEKGSVLLQQEDGKYHYVAAIGFNMDLLEQITFKPSELPFDHSDTSLSSMVVSELAKVSEETQSREKLEMLRVAGGKDNLKTTLFVPVRLNGEIKGIFSLDSANSAKISQSSVEMAHLLGLQVAIMLQRLDMLKRSEEQGHKYQQLYRDAERRRARLSLLSEIRKGVSSVNGIQDVRRLLETSTEVISKAFGGASVSLLIQSRLCNDELFISGYKQSRKVVKNFMKGHDFISRAISSKKDNFIRDLKNSEEYNFLNSNTKSNITILLKSENNIFGLMNIEHFNNMDNDHFEIAKELGQQLSIGIARAQLFEQLTQSESKLRLLAENSRDIISLHTLDGKSIYISPSIEVVLGYKASEIVGQRYDYDIHPDDFEAIHNYYLTLQSSPSEASNSAVSYRKKHKSGNYIWLETVLGYTHDDNGNINGFVASSREIGKRKEMELELRKLALFDQLTGLTNKTLLLDRIDHMINRSARRQSSFALLLFDIDRFKPINDSFGHEIGDQLLIEVAARMKQVLRKGDTAARLGGDEFCILLEDLSSEAQALDIMSRVQKSINDRVFILDSIDISVSASFGLAFNTGNHQTARELLSDADTAMYEAKKSKNEIGGFAIYNQAMRRKSQELLTTDNALRKAIENDEFKIVYQPIIELKTKKLKGFESLLRWTNKDCNCLTSPDYFIPIAEANDYIKVIDNWVLNTVAKQVAEWNKKYDMSDISVSINISPNTFEMPSFPYKLDEIILANGIMKNNLSLELTERTIMQAPGKGMTVLEMLQARGIKIYVDDFGTGYSSLNYLYKLNFDVLKIDRSFINLIGNQSNEALVNTIIKLAQHMNLKTIAEGIETEEQLNKLIDLGCEYGQGWLFSKGLEPAEIEKYYLKDEVVVA